MADIVEDLKAELEAVAARGAELDEAPSEQKLREANAALQRQLSAALKKMRDVPKERRAEVGKAVNAVKVGLEERFEGRLEALAREAREAELSGPMLDVSLPGRAPTPGRLHPVTRVKHELLDIFQSLGFEVADGPEVDTHANCFDKLGFPPDHPATDMQDSFFLTHTDEGDPVTTLLRTHTSTVQIREMSRRPPPLAVVSPGAVFRRDDDATHSPMFHQLEGFLVDEHVSFAHLKGVLTLFLERVFGPDIEVRFRPSYFPFVEPGAEVDVRRPGQDWMEILGCGMIHPVVFEHVGYDPEKVSGFAFGMGIDRMAMVKYGVVDREGKPSIKLLFENDVRFLSSF